MVSNLRQGWKATWKPDGIPNFDIADYLLRAHQIADARDLSAWVAKVLEPDVHPPMHPAITGLWLSLVSRETAGACVLAFVEYAAALALLVPLGALVAGRSGAAAGLVACVLTSMSLLHRGLSTAPMTEPMSMFAVNLTLVAALLAWRRPSVGAALGVGVAVCAAGLVRYNLLPMLLVPLFVAHGLRVATGSGRWFEPFWWVLPSTACFAGWVALRPELPRKIQHFFTNVDSGVPLWSEENLAWIPTQFAQEVAGEPALAIGTAGALVVGGGWSLSRLRRDPGEVLLHAFVLVAAAALFVHRYKLGRNLYVVAPVAYLAAALPVCRVLSRSLAASITASVLAMAGWWVLRERTDGRVIQRNFSEQPALSRVLDDVTQTAVASQRMVIAGAHRELNAHLLELHLRSAAPATVLVFQPPYAPGCEDGSTPPEHCRPGEVERWADTPGTAFLTVAQTRGLSRKGASNRRQWTARMAREVRERLSNVSGLTETRSQLKEAGLEVTLWTPVVP